MSAATGWTPLEMELDERMPASDSIACNDAPKFKFADYCPCLTSFAESKFSKIRLEVTGVFSMGTMLSGSSHNLSCKNAWTRSILISSESGTSFSPC